MNISEFAHTYCSHILREVTAASLYEQIAAKDDLPYDDIQMTEDGVMSKVVYVDDDGRTIDIYELIAYSKSDVEATKDEDLIQVYNNYMAQVDVEAVNLEDMLRLVREWKEARMREDANGYLS